MLQKCALASELQIHLMAKDEICIFRPVKYFMYSDCTTCTYRYCATEHAKNECFQAYQTDPRIYRALSLAGQARPKMIADFLASLFTRASTFS